MSRTALEVKASRKPKFSSRAYNRCPICGRPRVSIKLMTFPIIDAQSDCFV